MSEQPKGFTLDEQTKKYIKYGIIGLVVLILVIILITVIVPKLTGTTASTSSTPSPAPSKTSAGTSAGTSVGATGSGGSKTPPATQPASSRTATGPSTQPASSSPAGTTPKPWSTFTVGQPINCKNGDPTGINTGGKNGGGVSIYRYTGNNTMSAYPSADIALSWDSNWNNPTTINCDGLTKGANMKFNPASPPAPLYYITQVFNNTSPISTSPGIQGGSFFQNLSGVPTNWKKSIVTYGGTCVIDLSFTAYVSSANQGINFALVIDDVVQTPHIYYFFNKASDHKTIPASFTFKDLEAGTHTIGLYVSYGGSSSVIVDYNDTLNMRVIEYSKSLTTGPTPQIYLTQVFNQKPPLGSNVAGIATGITAPTFSTGSVVPPNWSKPFTSYGGTCVIDLCFSAFVTSPNEGINFALLIDGIAQTPIIFYFFNTIGDHRTIPASFTIKDLAGGDHTIGLFISYGGPSSVHVDYNDTLTMRITEFSKTLTTGPTPQLYLTQVFNQQSPFSSFAGTSTDLIGTGSFTGSGVPRNSKWSTTAKTYGGICLIDVSFTAYVGNANYVSFALVIDDIQQTPPIFMTFNLKSEHRSIYSSFTIPNLPAGDHKFGLSIDIYGVGNVYVDFNDILNMRIMEFMTPTAVLNTALPPWAGFPTGQAINCGMNDPTGLNTGGKNGGGVSIYRYTGNNTMSAYPNPDVALSWDSNWNNPSTINCNGLTKGANMTARN